MIPGNDSNGSRMFVSGFRPWSQYGGGAERIVLSRAQTSWCL